MNGTTAYDMFMDPDFRVDTVKVPLCHRLLSRLMSFGTRPKTDDRSNIERGVWNVFPTLEGDHMWLQGGLMHKHDIRGFYLDLLELIDSLKN